MNPDLRRDRSNSPADGLPRAAPPRDPPVPSSFGSPPDCWRKPAQSGAPAALVRVADEIVDNPDLGSVELA